MIGPSPPQAVAALAALLRQRIAHLSGAFGPLRARGRDGVVLSATGGGAGSRAATLPCAIIVVGAAAPFAPTPHARARLLRQLYACGLLTGREAERAVDVRGASH